MAKRGRPNKTQAILNNLNGRSYEPKTPIASGMYLPNYSGVKGADDKLKVRGFTDGSVLFAKDQKIEENNGGFFWDNTNHRLGLGTTSPDVPLHISKNSTSHLVRFDGGLNTYITVERSGTDRLAQYRLLGQSGSTEWSIGTTGVPGDLNSDFHIMDGDGLIANSKFTVQNTTGSVGIGTTNPTEKLEVYPDTDNSGIIGRAHIGIMGTCTDCAGFSHVDQDGNTSYALIQGATGDTALNAASGKEIFFRIGAADKMNIDANGNVGIGTITHTEKLEVYPDTDNNAKIGRCYLGDVGFNDFAGFCHVDNVGTGTYAILQGADGSTFINSKSGKDMSFRVNNNTKMTIKSDGKVGIGTAAPDNTFHLDGIFTFETTANGDGKCNMWLDSQGALIINNAAGTDTNAFIDLRAEGNNFGVVIRESDGTGTSTYANLYVKDDTKDYLNIVLNSAASTAGLVLTEDENVGIGTFTPNAKLDVRGTISQSEITQTFSGTKVLTDGSATGFVDIAIATGEFVSGDILYSIHVTDVTDFPNHMGGIGFVAVNKAGTVTSDCDETYVPASEIEVVTSGTLTDAVTCTDGANKITINMNANTSLAGATITLHYTIRMHSMNTITAL
jgi:hypothetical protein